jgi:Rha family phage regulatory protein
MSSVLKNGGGDTTKTPLELVFLQGERAVTTSLMVAEVFEKRHDHILRDIEKIRETIEQSNSSHSPQNWGELGKQGSEGFFCETVRQTDGGFGSRDEPFYLITRDGFTLLAMGFTGEKALKFKLEYIAAFNRMAVTLGATASSRHPAPSPAPVSGTLARPRRIDFTEAEFNAITERLGGSALVHPLEVRNILLDRRLNDCEEERRMILNIKKEIKHYLKELRRSEVEALTLASDEYGRYSLMTDVSPAPKNAAPAPAPAANGGVFPSTEGCRQPKADDGVVSGSDSTPDSTPNQGVKDEHHPF